MRTSKKLWTRLMSIMEWEGISNWDMMNDQAIADNIPLVQTWVRHHLKYIMDMEVRRTFKEFYFPSSNYEGKRSPHFYTQKAYGDHAIASLYNYERDQA